MTNHSREDGAVLVIALAFIAIFGIVVGALLGFVDAGHRAGVAVGEVRSDLYAAESAINAAIQRVANTRSLAVDGAGCLTNVPVPALEEVVGDARVRVSCVGHLTTGGSSDQVGVNMPSHAVWAAAGSGEAGIVQQSSGVLGIGGPIFSNTSIDVSPQAVLRATDGSTPASVTVRSGQCALPTIDGVCSVIGSLPFPLPPEGPFPVSRPYPDYSRRSDAPAVSAMAPGVVPACSGSVTTIQPGYFSSAAALNQLTDEGLGGGCSGVIWFRPGVYYFDFQDAGSHAWNITGSSRDVVAGAPLGWDPSSASRPAIPRPGRNEAGELSDEHACKTARDDATSGEGVQFIFGGDSRMFVQDARVQLCASPTTNEQQIAIYGNPTGQTPPDLDPLTGTGTVRDSTFDDAANAEVIDGQFAAFDTSGGLGSLTLESFLGPDAIPASAVIRRVAFRVRHQEEGDVQSLLLRLKGADGSDLRPPIGSQGNNCRETERLCLGYTEAQEFEVSPVPTRDQIISATVEYRAQIRNNRAGIAGLDGVALIVEFDLPVYRKVEGCLEARPYTGAETPLPCSSASVPGALITTRGAPTVFWIGGTVYAPTAAIDVEVTNQSPQVFRRGVIARTIIVKPTASSPPDGGQIIDLPDGNFQAGDGLVEFVAEAVPSGAKVRATVEFDGPVIRVRRWAFES